MATTATSACAAYSDEHTYLVTYDISDEKRWRAIFKMMHGYGEWMQLSVFQCRLTLRAKVEMLGRLTATMSATEDHILVIDLGQADRVEPKVQSLGKRGFDAIERAPVIV